MLNMLFNTPLKITLHNTQKRRRRRIIAWNSGFASRKLSRYEDRASWPSCGKASLTAAKLVPEVYNWWSSAFIESLAIVMGQGKRFQSRGTEGRPLRTPSAHLIPVAFRISYNLNRNIDLEGQYIDLSIDGRVITTQITSNYLASTLITVWTSVIILANCLRKSVRN